MKNIFSILLFFLFCNTTFSQEEKKFESLDSFFAGLPLQKGYDKWVEHIYSTQDLGIDSADKRAIYSSLKSNIRSHFPFPDSVKVKMLLFTEFYIDPSGRLPVDTIRSALIEGIFGNSRNAKNDADKCFSQLRSLLSKKYKSIKGDQTDYATDFTQGLNKNFPDIYLEKGYYKEKNYYYVLLRYEYNQ